jgi:hypothetical protein
LSDLMEVIRFGGLFLAKPKENCKEKNWLSTSAVLTLFCVN